MTGRRALLSTAALLALPGTALAQSNTRAGVDVSAGAGWSKNPFTVAGGDASSGFVALDVAPYLQVLRETSTLTVSGDASIQEYFRRYATAENLRASLDYRVRPNERLNLHARADLTSSIIGSANSFGVRPGFGGFDPDTGAPIGDDASGVFLPPVNDIGLFGTRDRRRSAYGAADFGYTLSDRDSITGSAFGEISRYKRFSDLGDYESFGGTLGYSRAISNSVRLGLQGSASMFDYQGPRGDSSVYSIQATGSLRLNERWSADGQLGVSFVDSDGGAGSTRKTSASGALNLCRRGPLSNFCLSGSRQVRPTGFSGSQYVTAIQANWSMRVSERDTLTLSSGYSREGGARLPTLPLAQNRYFQANAGYARRLSERLSATANAQYRDISGIGPSRPADYGGRIGLSYRLGDLR